MAQSTFDPTRGLTGSTAGSGLRYVKKFTYSDVEIAWKKLGGPANEAPIAAAIVMAESGGDPLQESHNSDGSVDRGLFQINSVHGDCSTTNTDKNIECAIKLFKK